MEQNNTSNSNAGKGMGIAGLVLGILATLFSFIPCLGMWAVVPGVVGVILSAISMKQAGATGGSKGMAIGGLITSIIGIAIACYWIYALYFAANALNQLKDTLEQSGALDSLGKAMQQLKEVTDTLNTH